MGHPVGDRQACGHSDATPNIQALCLLPRGQCLCLSQLLLSSPVYAAAGRRSQMTPPAKHMTPAAQHMNTTCATHCFYPQASSASPLPQTCILAPALTAAAATPATNQPPATPLPPRHVSRQPPPQAPQSATHPSRRCARRRRRSPRRRRTCPAARRCWPWRA